MMHDLPMHRPTLYNPALWSREEVKTYFIARQAILDRIVGDLRREQPDTKPQHRLILGQRGMGKSTLLRRISIAVEEDAALNAEWLPLTFPEEQYNVATLADFWLNCLDAMSDFLESRGDDKRAAEIDAKVEMLDRQDANAALKTLLQSAKSVNRRLLLLVDNIDLILERLKEKDWTLRETFQEHREIMLIGASARALEASYDYGAAFYDFFKVDELRGLTLEEMRETILTLARMRGAEDVIRKVEKDPVRLQVLHTLTGGNPRTAVLLYGVLLKGVDGNVRTDLEGLLDEVTPLYKARFEELPPLSQQVLDKLALHWDPMTARQLADELEADVNLASSQLARLVEVGVVEKVKAGRGKRTAFQVGERFFNIWYLMRASRRVRRKLIWLVEFLRMFYNADELKHMARTRLATESGDTKEAEYQLALAQAMPREPICRALETHALEILFAYGAPVKLDEVLDVSGRDKDLLPHAERIRLLQAARKKLQQILTDAKVSFSIEDFIEKQLGLPVPPETKQELIEEILGSESVECESLNRMYADLGSLWSDWARQLGLETAEKLRKACAHGEMIDDEDVEGGAAAAERYSCPSLAFLPKLMRARFDSLPQAEVESLVRHMTELDATGAYYWLRLGDLLSSDDERFTDAESAYRKAIQIDPESSAAWYGLSLILPVMTGRLDDAEIAFQKWTQLSPDNPASWASYALYNHLFEKDAVSAESFLKKAEEIPEKTPDGLRLMAYTLFLMHQPDRALLHCRELMKTVSDEYMLENIHAVLAIIRKGLEVGAGSQLLVMFDETEAGQRWRPIREALAAAVESNAEILNGIAPEVRKPALEILEYLAPQLMEHEPV